MDVTMTDLTFPPSNKSLFCSIILQELSRYANQNNLRSSNPVLASRDVRLSIRPEFCEFPLICTNDDLFSDCSCRLEVHPRLLTTSLATLPLHANTYPFLASDTLPEFKLIAQGGFGVAYRTQMGNYIVKLQKLDIPKDRRARPFVVYESKADTLVAAPFIMEALALYAWNRYEDEHGCFNDNNYRTAPRIYYSSILQTIDGVFSAIVMEDLSSQNLVELESILEEQVFGASRQLIKALAINPPIQDDIIQILLTINDLTLAIEQSKLQFVHQDMQAMNIFVSLSDNRAVLIDFGMVAFLLPNEYVCALETTNPIPCRNNCIPIKSSSIIVYGAILPENQVLLDSQPELWPYNMSTLWQQWLWTLPPNKTTMKQYKYAYRLFQSYYDACQQFGAVGIQDRLIRGYMCKQPNIDMLLFDYNTVIEQREDCTEDVNAKPCHKKDQMLQQHPVFSSTKAVKATYKQLIENDESIIDSISGLYSSFEQNLRAVEIDVYMNVYGQQGFHTQYGQQHSIEQGKWKAIGRDPWEELGRVYFMLQQLDKFFSVFITKYTLLQTYRTEDSPPKLSLVGNILGGRKELEAAQQSMIEWATEYLIWCDVDIADVSKDNIFTIEFPVQNFRYRYKKIRLDSRKKLLDASNAFLPYLYQVLNGLANIQQPEVITWIKQIEQDSKRYLSRMIQFDFENEEKRENEQNGEIVDDGIESSNEKNERNESCCIL